MKNIRCILALALLWPSLLWGIEEINSSPMSSNTRTCINQNQETPNFIKQFAKEIIDDALFILSESKSINMSNIIRTIKISMAYHECLDELTTIFMPKPEETISDFKARTTPSKTKLLVSQIIHNKANSLDSLSPSSAQSEPNNKKGARRKNKDLGDYSTLEFQNLHHIYSVWSDSGVQDAEAVIKAYLDTPLEQLSKAYNLAKSQGLLRSFYEVAFVPGCIAIKTNKLEQWYLRHNSGERK